MSRTPYWRWFGAVVDGYRPEIRWPGGREAIVGYAKNYRLDDLRPFITSVRIVMHESRFPE